MTDKERKKAVRKLAKAFESLGTDQRQYMLGYADGVVAAKEKTKEVTR